MPQGNFVAHWQRGAEGLGFAQAADYGGEFRAPFHFTLGHSATFSERPIRHNRARGSDRSPIRGWKPERGRSQGRGARYARSAAKRASILDGSPSGGYRRQHRLQRGAPLYCVIDSKNIVEAYTKHRLLPETGLRCDSAPGTIDPAAPGNNSRFLRPPSAN